MMMFQKCKKLECGRQNVFIMDLGHLEVYNIITNWTLEIFYRGKKDAVAEWLRRWTANPMGSARVGSNPIGVELLIIGMISFMIR